MAQAFCQKRYTHFIHRGILSEERNRLKVAGRKVPKSVLLIIQREIKSLNQTCKPDKQNSFEQAEPHYQRTIYFGSTHKPTNNKSFTVVDSHLFGINCKVKATHELKRKLNPFDSERGDTEPNSRALSQFNSSLIKLLITYQNIHYSSNFYNNLRSNE